MAPRPPPARSRGPGPARRHTSLSWGRRDARGPRRFPPTTTRNGPDGGSAPGPRGRPSRREKFASGTTNSSFAASRRTVARPVSMSLGKSKPGIMRGCRPLRRRSCRLLDPRIAAPWSAGSIPVPSPRASTWSSRPSSAATRTIGSSRPSPRGRARRSTTARRRDPGRRLLSATNSGFMTPPTPGTAGTRPTRSPTGRRGRASTSPPPSARATRPGRATCSSSAAIRSIPPPPIGTTTSVS